MKDEDNKVVYFVFFPTKLHRIFDIFQDWTIKIFDIFFKTTNVMRNKYASGHLAREMAL